MTLREQCKEPCEFIADNFEGMLFCLLDKGHGGIHRYEHSSEGFD